MFERTLYFRCDERVLAVNPKNIHVQYNAEGLLDVRYDMSPLCVSTLVEEKAAGKPASSFFNRLLHRGRGSSVDVEPPTQDDESSKCGVPPRIFTVTLAKNGSKRG